MRNLSASVYAFSFSHILRQRIRDRNHRSERRRRLRRHSALASEPAVEEVDEQWHERVRPETLNQGTGAQALTHGVHNDSAIAGATNSKGHLFLV